MGANPLEVPPLSSTSSHFGHDTARGLRVNAEIAAREGQSGVAWARRGTGWRGRATAPGVASPGSGTAAAERVPGTPGYLTPGYLTPGAGRAPYRVGGGIRIWSPGWMVAVLSVGFQA